MNQNEWMEIISPIPNWQEKSAVTHFFQMPFQRHLKTTYNVLSTILVH